MKLSDVKKLHQKKYRSQLGYYLVEGEHLVLELLNAIGAGHPRLKAKDIVFYVTEQYHQWLEAKWPFETQCKAENITSQQMAQMSDTKSPQGIIARVPLPSTVEPDGAAAIQGDSKYIYLYETQDPGNLGTILRSLAWFGNYTLLMSPNCVDPFNSKVVRASMGAIFHLDMELNVPLESLAERFERIAYLDMDGQGIQTPSFNEYQCFLFGNEARGVPTEAVVQLKATAFTIPGSGKIDSLNLASAVNICVYELSR
ncbi:RNA methyltransferase [Alteromonas sp. D210916BOD_24]|uniref:TrmH family RNA methyltransferase n=1 Tax=Alteromonas sp. D210916BOD_24 TaxID=3157618 RepID=UPI00399C6818